jgi:hypothetical protein
MARHRHRRCCCGYTLDDVLVVIGGLAVECVYVWLATANWPGP